MKFGVQITRRSVQPKIDVDLNEITAVCPCGNLTRKNAIVKNLSAPVQTLSRMISERRLECRRWHANLLAAVSSCLSRTLVVAATA